jgi:hypothetical protein
MNTPTEGLSKEFIQHVQQLIIKLNEVDLAAQQAGHDVDTPTHMVVAYSLQLDVLKELLDKLGDLLYSDATGDYHIVLRTAHSVHTLWANHVETVNGVGEGGSTVQFVIGLTPGQHRYEGELRSVLKAIGGRKAVIGSHFKDHVIVTALMPVEMVMVTCSTLHAYLSRGEVDYVRTVSPE